MVYASKEILKRSRVCQGCNTMIYKGKMVLRMSGWHDSSILCGICAKKLGNEVYAWNEANYASKKQ